MKFIAASDLHLSGVAPKSRIDPDYPEELFELLDQLTAAAKAVEARAIIFPGDITHVRAKMSFTVLARFIGWCQALRSDGIDVVGIPGNHDLHLNRYETLDRTPLGLLFDIGAIWNVSTTRGGRPVAYYEDKGEGVTILGVPFPDAFALDQWRSVRWAKPSQTIVLGHCFANLTAGTYYGDPVHSYAELLEATNADYIVLGHDHTDRGVFRYDDPQRGPRYVIDLPAMARTGMSEGDIGRDLKFAIIDTDAREVKQYRLKYRPAAEIFDLARRDALRAEQAQVEAFVTQLQADLQAQQQVTSLDDKLDALHLPAQVRDRVVAYIEAAEQAQVDALNG